MKIFQKNNNLLIKKNIIDKHFNIFNLLTASSIGDLHSVIILNSKGVDLNTCDYDKRSALHLACSENRLNIVEYFVTKNVNKNIKDRWNNKPVDDAIKNKKKI